MLLLIKIYLFLVLSCFLHCNRLLITTAEVSKILVHDLTTKIALEKGSELCSQHNNIADPGTSRFAKMHSGSRSSSLGKPNKFCWDHFIHHSLLNIWISFSLRTFRETSRWSSEVRPRDYLTTDFEERMSGDGIQYKLQIQLHEIQPDDSHLVLHPARAWDHATHPWFDLADVRLASLLPLDVTECTRSSLGNMPLSLSLPPAKTIYDYSSIANLRSKFLSDPNKNCSIRRPSKPRGEGLSIYCISVFTGDRKKAGTNANVMLTITGKIW